MSKIAIEKKKNFIRATNAKQISDKKKNAITAQVPYVDFTTNSAWFNPTYRKIETWKTWKRNTETRNGEQNVWLRFRS